MKKVPNLKTKFYRQKIYVIIKKKEQIAIRLINFIALEFKIATEWFL